MKLNSFLRIGQLAFLLMMLMGHQLVAGDVTVEQAADRSVRVMAKTYQVAFDPSGRWTSLVIAGTEMLGAGMAFPGKAAPSEINVRTHLLAIRNAQVIVEFAFEPNGFEISIDGANAQIGLTDKTTALVTGKQGVKGPEVKNLPDIRKVIVGEAAFDVAPGVVYRGGNLLVFASAKEASKPVRVRIECGVAASAVNLVELSDFQIVGPPTKTVAEIQVGHPVKWQARIRNLSSNPIEPTLTYTISNALAGGQMSAPVTVPPLPLGAGASQTLEIPMNVTTPGIHWVNLELQKDGEVIQRERTAFVYAAGEFRPPLTRPGDFSEFWKRRLDAMRAIPLEPAAKEIPARSSAVAAHYEITMKGTDGKPLTFELQVPRKAGPHLALFGGKMPEKAENPGMVQLVFPHKQWPEEATYNRWVSAEDNNHLDCYLLAVRLTDYLRARDDVDRIFLFGASRQGPIQLANAALDPTKVVAVDAHVPTSMGLSWVDLPYKGWGRTPNPPAMAAYVDPVNLAPDLRVPVMLDEGVYDGLSPAPGALAFFNHAVNAPWKRISIEPGGHGFFTSGFRPEARKELEKILGYSLEGKVDEGILREH